MDNIRDSFSRAKEDLKHWLKRKKREPGKTGANVAGERVDSSDSLSRQEPRVTAGGGDGEGNRSDTDRWQDHPRDRSPQPEPVPADGSDNDGKELSQECSRPDPTYELVVDGGPRREIERVHPSSTAPSIPPTGEPDSTRTIPFQLLCLTVPSTSQPPLPFLITRQNTVPTKELN